VSLTLADLQAASDAMRKAAETRPPMALRCRMNVATLGYVKATFGTKDADAALPMLVGIPVFTDWSLATGIVEVEYEHGIIRTIDLGVRLTVPRKE